MELLPDGTYSDFNEYLNKQAGALPGPSVPAWQRALAYAVGLPANVLSNMGQSVGGLLGQQVDPLTGPEDQMVPPTTGAQGLTDVIGQGIAPMAVELALTGKAINPALGATPFVSQSPVIANTIRDALQFGFLGAQEGRGTALEQAGEGAGMGIASAFSRVGRLPIAALLAAGSKSYFDSQGGGEKVGNFMGHDWSRGDISALALGAGTMFAGKAPWRTPITDHFGAISGDWQGPINPDDVQGPPQEFFGPHQPWQGPIHPSSIQGPNPPMGPGTITPEGVILAGPGRLGPRMRPRGDFVSPEIGTGEVQPTNVSTPETNPYAIVPSNQNVPWQTLFNPKDNEFIQSNFGRSIDDPEVQDALLRLKMGISQAMVRSDRRDANLAFMKFFEEMGHKPDVTALSPEQGEAAWQDIVRRGKGSQLANAPLVSNPLPEGDPIGMGITPPKIPIAQGELQSAVNALPEVQALQASQQLSRAEALSEAQAEAARRGKIPDLPEYRRTEGGNSFQDIVTTGGLAAGRALMGGFIGGALPADNEDDRMLHAAIGGGLLLGLPYAKDLVGLAQKMRRGDNLHVQEFNTGEAATFGPRYRSSSVPPTEQYRGTVADNHFDPTNPHSRYAPVSDESLHSMQTSFDRREEARAELQRVIARKGKINPIPEYRRTEGGSLINPLAETGGLPSGITPKVKDIQPAIRLKDGTIIHEDGARVHADLVSSRVSELLAEEGADFGFIARGQYIPRDDLPKLLGTDEAAGSVSLRQAIKSGSLNPDQPLNLGGGQKGGVADPFPKSGSGMKPGSPPLEGGFAIPELSAAVGRGLIGGLLGGAIGSQFDDINDHEGFMFGALAGAAAGAFGPSIGRSILNSLSKTRASVPKVKGEGWSGFVRNFPTKLEESAGATFNGSQKVSDRFLRFLDSGLSLSMPLAVKNVLLQAKGAGAVLLDMIDSSILNISLRYKPDDIVKEITNHYFDGDLGVGGDGVKAYLAAMQPHLAGKADVLAYSKFAVAARTSVDGLQRMLAEGLGDEKLKAIIGNSIGKYLTRSYKLFTDPRYQPSSESIDALASYLAGVDTVKGGKTVPLMGTTNMGDIKSGLYQYIREVKATKGNYVASSSVGQSIDQGLLKERVTILDPHTRKPLLDAMGNPVQTMRQEWRNFFGEITDPTQRIYQTVFRLRPMAEASKFFHDVSNVEVNGIPQVFDAPASMDAFRNTLLQSMQKLPADQAAARAGIEKQIASLNAFQRVDALTKFGELQGKMVSRHVWDTLKTYDSLTDTSSGWMRSIANAHTAIKLTRTALSPITVLRNLFTAPFFLAIGRGSLTDAVEAWKITRDPTHPLREEILRMGIANVDQVKTEFHKEFDNLMGSKYNFGEVDLANLGLSKFDLDIYEKVARRGFRSILDAYRLPDNVTRIASYLSARRRIAEELGKAINDPEVLEKATNWTNRYTMNYDALPPMVKTLRQVPLVNLFLSYTAEIARIGKNLVEDVVKGGDGVNSHGRLYAMTMLSTIAVLPELLQSASENSLSDKDREEWEQMKKIMPSYNRTRYRFGIQKDPKTGMFSYYDFTPLIPSDSYNQMGRAIKNQDWAALAQVNPFVGLENTPALNIVAHQIMGKDRTKDFRPLGFGGASDRFASIAREVTPPIPIVFPWTNEGEKWTLAYSTNASGEFGLTNSKTGVRVTPADVWFPYFTGIRPGSMSSDVIFKQFQAQAKQDVANEISYANQMLKMKDLAPAKRDQIVQKTKAAISAIQQRYMEQAGMNVDHTP